MKVHLTHPKLWPLCCLFVLPACNISSDDGPSGAIDLPKSGTPNTAPVAVADSYSTELDTPMNLSAPGTLANDSDADGDSLTAVLVSSVSNGTLTLNSDGSFDYTPTPGYEGPDSFSYMANDGLLDSPAATVSIMVNGSAFVCTEVIGFSQTGQWYNSFDAAVDGENWQGRTQGGADIRKWSDPNFDGWDIDPASPCTSSSTTPDRAVLTISDSNTNSDPQVWADNIDRAVTTLNMVLPSVTQVLLQPVVGGPGHSVCQFNGSDVRATINHPVIDQAISLVVANHSVDISVAAGFSPEVQNCSDYRDSTGHLTDVASDAVGREIGSFYVDR